jgi:hypothetical protein
MPRVPRVGLGEARRRGPADLRFGQLVPCPGCGDAVRELRELRVMDLLQEYIASYTAFRSSLQECTFENLDTASDERVAANRGGQTPLWRARPQRS